MIAQQRRMALLAGLLTAALSAPALAEDVDALNAKAPAADELMVALASPPVNPGPMIDRESLGTKTSAKMAVVGSSQPTRTATNVSPPKRTHAAAGPGPYSNYRYRPAPPQLILGTRF
jgi:hypothetical protein